MSIPFDSIRVVEGTKTVDFAQETVIVLSMRVAVSALINQRKRLKH